MSEILFIYLFKFNSFIFMPQIFINENQRNNPIVKDFKFNFSYKNDLKCDFKPKENIECIYLSLKYHLIYPQYISNKFKNLSKNDFLGITRYLICFFDIKENNDLKEKEDKISEILKKENNNFFIPDKTKENKNESIGKIEQELININILCEEYNILLLLTFSSKEIGQYIHSLSLIGEENKNYKSKIKNENQCDDLIETICCIDTINKNDANKLFNEYKSISNIFSNINSNDENIKTLIDNKKINAIIEFLYFDFNNFSN